VLVHLIWVVLLYLILQVVEEKHLWLVQLLKEPFQRGRLSILILSLRFFLIGLQDVPETTDHCIIATVGDGLLLTR